MTITQVEAKAVMAVFFEAARTLMTTTYLPAIVENVTDDGETFMGLRCPWCATLLSDHEGSIIELDWATRENDALPQVSDEGSTSLAVYQGDDHFETLTYLCSSCRTPIGVPSGTDVEWS